MEKYMGERKVKSFRVDDGLWGKVASLLPDGRTTTDVLTLALAYYVEQTLARLSSGPLSDIPTLTGPVTTVGSPYHHPPLDPSACSGWRAWRISGAQQRSGPCSAGLLTGQAPCNPVATRWKADR